MRTRRVRDEAVLARPEPERLDRVAVETTANGCEAARRVGRDLGWRSNKSRQVDVLFGARHPCVLLVQYGVVQASAGGHRDGKVGALYLTVSAVEFEGNCSAF